MDVVDAINERRSINFFEPGIDISMEKLEELVNLASLAPSSMNLQPWDVIIVNKHERKMALKKCAFNQPKVEEASVVIIMIADPAAVEKNMDRALDSWAELGFIKPEMKENYKSMAVALYGTPDSLQRKIFAVKNASLFAMNLMIAAKGLGLETHPMDGFDQDAIKREFNIPEDKIIPMLIAVGHLKKGITLLPRAFRRNFGEIVHSNNY